MNRKEFEKKIEEASKEFIGMDANYIGMIYALISDQPWSSNYVRKVEVAKAIERIETLKRLKSLDLLK